jgi:putative ABC transport system permease protein
MTAATRCFRALLHAYPAAFREEYGDEMTWAFAERHAAEGAWRVWPATVLEVFSTAVREHLDVTRRDVRVAIRGLSRTPALTLVILLALAIGVGANTTVYTVVRQVLWAPLPYAEADRLAVVLEGGRGPLPPAIVADLREQVPAFEDVAAAELWGPTWTGGPHPERLPAMRVTPNLFALLGVPAAVGRTPTSGDARGVVISHRFWQERFGAARDVIGRELLLEGVPHPVLGVMPPAFAFSPFWARAEVWGPLDLAPRRDDRGGASLRTFARLRRGASMTTAQQQVAALDARLRAIHPVAHRDVHLQAQSLHAKVTGDVRPLLWTLLLAAACVLLVTCVNVASLLLARAVQRQPEMAVRVALGGRSPAISRQLLTESLLLATLGAAAGLALACWLVSLVPGLTRLGLPRIEDVSVDWRMATVAIALGMLTGLAFGLAPVWTTRRNLRLGPRGASESGRARRMRAGFVVGEVTLAVVLVVTAGLLVRSFQRLSTTDPGFQPEGLLAIEVSAHAAPAWRTNRGVLFEQVVERTRAVPGVTSAAVINHVPLAGDAWGMRPLIEGAPADARARAVWRVTGPGYPATAGIRLTDGRDFTPQDGEGAPLVVMVNDAFARQYLHGVALGKRLSFTDEGEAATWRTVVGVVGDVRQQEWAAAPEPEVYVPLAQTPEYLNAPKAHFSAMTLVARTTGDPGTLAAAIRNGIWGVDADLALGKPITLADEAARQLWRPQFASMLVSGFGVLALLLAATGLYGLVAHDAGQRTREIGIRLALGAPLRAVIASVLGRGLGLVAAGLAFGVVTAVVATSRLRQLLFDLPPHDPLVFTSTVAIFLLVGVAASAVPAWRASRIDAARAVRNE